jgi:glutathione-regulated potassium-efflux system protein KefB
MPDHQVLLIVTLLLAIGAATVLLFRRAGFCSVLALLATGMLLGPHGLDLAARTDESIRSLTDLGVVLLLFLIGLETQPARLWRLRRNVFGLGSAQLLVTGTALGGLAYLLTDVRPAGAFVLGFGLALSSTAFVLQLLQERSELPTRHGQAAFAVLLLQDLAVVPLLALLPLLSGQLPGRPESSTAAELAVPVLALGLLVVFGRWVIPRALEVGARQRNMEAFAMVTGAAVIGAAWAMEEAGMSMALGAFVMGMLLSETRYVHQVEAEVAPFKGLLLGLFFISIGLSMDLSLLGANALAILAGVVLVLVVKGALLLGLARLFGLDTATAVRLASLMSQGGEFGFVLLGAAALAGILPDSLHQVALLVISLSMAATPLIARLGDSWAQRLDRDEPAGVGLTAPDELDRHVVIAGFGRVGRNVAFMLEQAEIPYVAVDYDVSRVALGKREGRPVYFGTSTDPRLLAQLGVGRAAAVLITLDSGPAAERVVNTIRLLHPHVPLFVRARDLAMRDRLVAAGVNEAIPETIQLSISLGQALLRRIGVSDEQLEAVVDGMRQDNYAALRLGAIRERMAEVERAEGQTTPP